MAFIGPKAALLPAIFAASFLAASAAFAAPPVEPAIDSVTYHGVVYSTHEVDPKKDDLRMFWKDDQGKPLLDFVGLEKTVEAQGEKLLFAANAGMFEPDMKPVGLLVENGNEIVPINLNDGQGNFYMKPNGVFEINEKHEAIIIKADDYATLLTPSVWATQSGPLLVQRGAIHPDFNADSKSLKIRSGVGIRKDGTVVFALSRKGVNFYDFALLFRDKFKCPNALYLDGDISAFYVSGVKDPKPYNFGPMIGVVQKVP